MWQGHFPEADKDPVIQIASMVTVQGESTPTVKNVMTLKSCAAIVGAEVMSFNSEAEMLKVRLLNACHSVSPGPRIGAFNTAHVLSRQHLSVMVISGGKVHRPEASDVMFAILPPDESLQNCIWRRGVEGNNICSSVHMRRLIMPDTNGTQGKCNQLC